MISKRAVFQLLLLFALPASFAAGSPMAGSVQVAQAAQAQKPQPAGNAISDLKVQRAADGRWMVNFEYHYTGQPAGLAIAVQHTSGPGIPGAPTIGKHVATLPAERGTHRASVPMAHPGDDAERFTETVTVLLHGKRYETIATRTIAHRIEWPTLEDLRTDREFALKSPEAVLKKATALVDSYDRAGLPEAHALLRRLVEKHPQMEQAHLELARIAMKSQWGPEGLRQAETMIGSALRIRPDSVNARILLAYVYANQKRFNDSEKLMVESARLGTTNLWLWANWGDLYMLQGRNREAMAKYQEAIAKPPTRDGNDRARQHAYIRLLPLMDHRDLDAIEAVHKKSVADYGARNCLGLAYAWFLLTKRGDADGVHALYPEPPPSCESRDQREVMGLARYLRWSRDKDPEALRQARALLPVSARLFHTLASFERLAPVARQLTAAGEKVAMQDSLQLDALAHALGSGNTAAARRLLELGAPPDSLVGPDRVPVALLPVMSRDLEGIRLMQKAGVDYTTLRFQGATALEIARQTGDRKLLQVLDTKRGRT